MIAPALRLVAAVRNGARLVYRPGSPVVHVYRGPLTPSGRWVPRTGRTACRSHTRRLSVIETPDESCPSLGLDAVLVDGRRVCRRCTAAAFDATELADLSNRDDVAEAYAALTPADIALAGRWARSTNEAHQVGRVAMILHGPKPATPPARRTVAQAELAAMHDAINARRSSLALRELDPEARASIDHLAQARRDLEQRVAARRSKDNQRNRAIDRRTRGQYLTPHERDLLASA